jgi:hypothetical protein
VDFWVCLRPDDESQDGIWIAQIKGIPFLVGEWWKVNVLFLKEVKTGVYQYERNTQHRHGFDAVYIDSVQDVIKMAHQTDSTLPGKKFKVAQHYKVRVEFWTKELREQRREEERRADAEQRKEAARLQIEHLQKDQDNSEDD